MVLVKLDIHIKRMKLVTFLTPLTKVNLNWIWLNYKTWNHKTRRSPEQGQGSNPHPQGDYINFLTHWATLETPTLKFLMYHMRSEWDE